MILKDGRDFQPDITAIRAFMKAYPKLDLDAELAKMDCWCLANPGKRKTASGALRFINSWLSRAAPTPVTNSTRHRTLEQDLTDTSWA